MNIVGVILKESRKCQNNIAIIDQDRKVSYLELFKLIDQVSLDLKKSGVGKFKRIGLLCEDSLEYIIVSLAVLKLNAVIVPIPFGSSADEVEAILEEIKINMLIFEKSSFSAKKAKAILQTLGFKKELRLYNGKVKKSLPLAYSKLKPAFIRFSSGTTGISKGVVLSHKSIVERIDAANKGLKVTSADRVIWVLSMSFHFVVTILLFLRRGATIIISHRQFPYDLLDNLKRYKPTLIYASPFHYHVLCSLSCPRGLLSKLRLAVSTAVKLQPDLAARFYKRFGFELSEAYGIIEVGLPFINTSGNKNKRGSVGQVQEDYQLSINDLDSQGIGTIYIKGKGMFDAYFNPWKERKSVLVDGWFNTQDLGKLDRDKFLYIVGREKNVINFNGMKIFPSEVEAVLNRHPLIKESLVFGVSHIEYGQLPAAKIVLKDNARGINLEELRSFCYKHLANYKVPKDFICLDALEKTASGKLKV